MGRMPAVAGAGLCLSVAVLSGCADCNCWGGRKAEPVSIGMTKSGAPAAPAKSAVAWNDATAKAKAAEATRPPAPQVVQPVKYEQKPEAPAAPPGQPAPPAPPQAPDRA